MSKDQFVKDFASSDRKPIGLRSDLKILRIDSQLDQLMARFQHFGVSIFLSVVEHDAHQRSNAILVLGFVFEPGMSRSLEFGDKLVGLAEQVS